MCVDLSSVLIDVQFTKHYVYADIHSELNTQYGGILPSLDDLFVDPINQVELKENAVDILKQLVVDSITPHTSTKDRNPVSQALDSMPIKIAWKEGQSAMRLSTKTIYQAMKLSAQSTSEFRCCILTFSIQAFYFPANGKLLDWSEFTTSPHRHPQPNAHATRETGNTAVDLLDNQLTLDEPNWNTVRNILQKNPRAAISLPCSNNETTILHIACAKNAPLKVLRLILQQLPGLVKESNRYDLPLHVACAYQQSLEVIQKLVQLYPGALMSKNIMSDLPLHVACEKNQSFLVIQWLVRQHLDAVQEKNSYGRVPLHVACTKNQPLKVIQLLVQQHPDALHERGSDGLHLLQLACASHQSLDVIRWLAPQFPDALQESRTTSDNSNLLHTACSKKQSLKVIQWLVQQFPDALQQKNKNDELPLHVACADDQSLEVIDWLIQRHPNGVKEKSMDGSLPLHRACATKQCFKVVQRLVQQYTEALDGKLTDGRLPLHLACAEPQSLEVIQFLVQQHPDTIKVKSNDGSLALHEACVSKQPFIVIQWLVEQHPDAVQEKTMEGNLPLHLTCYYNQTFEVIDFLVQQYPDGNTAKNNHGYLPLHAACRCKQSLEVIDFLVQQHPNAITEKAKNGYLPLHAACCGEQSLAVINLLLQQHPDAIKEKSKDGDFPLHTACRYKLSFEVIVVLVQRYPDAITEKSKDGDLPLHLACQWYHPLKVIKFLVHRRPDTVKAKDNDGRTPFDVARDTGDYRSPDYDIVKWLMTFESVQIPLAKLPPVPPRRARKTPVELAANEESTLEDTRGSRELSLDSHAVGVEPDSTGAGSGDDLAVQQEFVVERASASFEALAPSAWTGTVNMDLAEPSTAALNDVIAEDCTSVQDILEGNDIAAASASYIESIGTQEIIGNGFFGTVCKGTDPKKHNSFAIKAINKDLRRGGRSANDQKTKETFRMEIETLSLFCHPIIDAWYAGASPEGVRCFCSELAEKGSLESFCKADLGPERLSPFRRRIQIALDVMTAIQFMHIGNDAIFSCFHGGITSANVVLKRDFTAQLTGCGLSKSVVDSQLETGVCSQYVCGGIPSEHAFDIYTFGVILMELLTGKLDHRNDKCGTSFAFEKQYMKDKNDSMRDIKDDPDPALGYDTFELPKFVQDFADLAICCLQPQAEDRPSGEVVMEKLVAVLGQCGSRTNDTSSRISDGESAHRNLDKSMDKCKLCRTFSPVVPHHLICAVCQAAEERRAQLLFWDETRRPFAATNAKLDVSPSLLRHLDTRLTYPVPRLFILMPFAVKTAMTHPRTWLRRAHRTRYYLYFVCMHSMKAIEPPIPIVVTKGWVEKVAPILAWSLVHLQLGLKPSAGIDLRFKESGMTLKLSSTRIAEMLDAVGDILIQTGSFDFLVRLRRDVVLDTQDINQLNGDAYELIVETACEERGWRDCMKPVRKNGSPQIFWVSRDVACDTSNGYDIDPVG